MRNNNNNQDRMKALEAAVASLEKEFGQGIVMRLGSNEAAFAIEVVPTGSISLDLALGVGGLPRGRITEVYGPEAAGKTTVALHVLAEVQKRGELAAFIDAEHAFDPNYAQAIGVDVDNLWISQPSTGEQALEVAEKLVRTGAFGAIVIDSVAALVPRAEIEGEMGDVHVGLQARMMSQALRKLSGTVSKTRTCLIFINQIRERIGVMFGDSTTTTGGRSLKFYASARIEVRRVQSLRQGDAHIGSRVRARVVKNKVAPPFREAEFDILYGKGISREGDILDLGVEHDIIEKSGAWYSYGEQRLGQGRENARAFLVDHPALASELEDLIREKLGIEVRESAG